MGLTQTKPNRAVTVPPLQNGDRLTRAEFERRFDATPGLKKAELIEGVVYMPPPVSFGHHGGPHADLLALFGAYRAATPGVLGGDNSSLRLDLDNMPQPDAFLMISAECGGQAGVDEDDYVDGAPELIGEIAASSVSLDLRLKLNLYRRSGVREYIVWRTIDREIDYFVLRDGRYDRPSTSGERRLAQRGFPGLWLAPKRLVGGDLAGALRVVQEGLGTPEHAAFLMRLAKPAQ